MATAGNRKKLIVLIVLVIILIAVTGYPKFSEYFLPAVEIDASSNILPTISVGKCFWVNGGVKYKCEYKNTGNQPVLRRSIKATAFNTEGETVSTILFPKYHDIPAGTGYTESISKTNSGYSVVRIYLELRTDADNTVKQQP